MKERTALHRLADLMGVRRSYRDIAGRTVEASVETLAAVLSALGCPVASPADAPRVLAERSRIREDRLCEPVTVAWEGEAAAVRVLHPAADPGDRALLRISLETGGFLERSCELQRAPAAARPRGAGRGPAAGAVPLPDPLPRGYHDMTVEVRGRTCRSLLIAAPRTGCEPSIRGWGVFLPLYAFDTRRSLGVGDLADLEALLSWTKGLGGRAVATLPLLSAFLDAPYGQSPYCPASRLFWNEVYLAVDRLPELARCPRARELMESAPFREEIAALRAAPRADLRRAMALKRGVLALLAGTFFPEEGPRGEAFRRWLAANPAAPDYAAFRAAGERLRAPWPAWPAPARDGLLAPDDCDEEARRFHLYAQFAFHEQIGEIAARGRDAGTVLYLDLPLGVGHDSYDVWRHRPLFARDVSAGAPPDDFFAKGQDWGFPPMSPEAVREDGYRYFRACLAHQLRQAGVLRIDHVMGFHRSFWIPRGMEARQGAYVRYPAEEFYAVLALESSRHGAWIAGEDLGTVPPGVRPAMARHGIRRLYVSQFSLVPDPKRPLRPVPAGSVASLNTHDMPPFAAFLSGSDVGDRLALGLMGGKEARVDRGRRRKLAAALFSRLKETGELGRIGPGGRIRAALSACLARLSSSRAALVVANLEDLWLETDPQNIPGTWRERINWARKTRIPFETFREMPDVADALREIDRIRRRAGTPPPTSAGRPPSGPGRSKAPRRPR